MMLESDRSTFASEQAECGHESDHMGGHNRSTFRYNLTRRILHHGMKHKKCGETKSSAFSSGNDQLSPEAQKPRELVIRRQPRSTALSRDTTTLLPDHRVIFQNRGTSALPCANDAAVPTAYSGGWLVAEVFRRHFLCWLRWGMTSYSSAAVQHAKVSIVPPRPACISSIWVCLPPAFLRCYLPSAMPTFVLLYMPKHNSLLHDIEASRCSSMLLH
jgi:hypothetical protein